MPGWLQWKSSAASSSSLKVSRVSAPGRIECPHCRQSIKRPPLPPGEKCLCPKCSQPFSLNAAGEGVAGATPAAPSPAPAPQAVAPQPASPTAPPKPPARPATPAASPAPAPTSAAAPAAQRAEKAVPLPAGPASGKPAEFRLNCYLCGSLLYARVDQIGSKIKCPDCHAENEVRKPKAQSIDSSDKPSLVGAQDFRMSDPGERPKFSPIERPPRDEDEDDDRELQLTPMPVTPTETAAKPNRPSADDGLVDVFGLHGGAPVPVPPAKPSAAPTIPSAPPAPRPSAAAAPSTSAAPPPAPPPRKYRKREESYGDELWTTGGGANAHLPRYKRSPFLVGVVEFLVYPATISRWIMLTALALVPIALIELAAGSTTEFRVFTAGSLFWGGLAAVCGLVWSIIFGAHVIAIVDDTANGLDAVENWPLVGEFPRSNPLFLAAALVPVAFASLLLSLFTVGSSWVALGPVAMLVGGMLLLPLAWLPMLLEKSFAAPMQSRLFWQSFRDSGDGWFVFGLETLMIGMVGAIGVSLWNIGSLIVTPLSAALLVTALLVYVRLLGRLLWYINPEMIPPPPPDKPGPPPLPETVDPTQFHR